MSFDLKRDQKVETNPNLTNLYPQLEMVGRTHKDHPSPSLKGHVLV